LPIKEGEVKEENTAADGLKPNTDLVAKPTEGEESSKLTSMKL
jgi:hypothetical protein